MRNCSDSLYYFVVVAMLLPGNAAGQGSCDDTSSSDACAASLADGDEGSCEYRQAHSVSARTNRCIPNNDQMIENLVAVCASFTAEADCFPPANSNSFGCAWDARFAGNSRNHFSVNRVCGDTVNRVTGGVATF